MAAVDLDEEELARLDEAMRRFERLHLTLTCEPSVGLAQIAAAVKVEKRRLARQGIALGVVFIDYLKFIKVSDRYQGNRVLE
ncbi:helicase DnaB, partial [Pseudomonas sp. FW215-L1]